MSKEQKTFRELELKRQYLEKDIQLEHDKISKQYLELEGDLLLETQNLSKQFEKEVKKLFKGIKITIKHTKYGMQVYTNNGNSCLFNIEYNNSNGNDIECYDELVEIYSRYYGKPKEKKDDYVPYETASVDIGEVNFGRLGTKRVYIGLYKNEEDAFEYRNRYYPNKLLYFEYHENDIKAYLLI